MSVDRSGLPFITIIFQTQTAPTPKRCRLGLPALSDESQRAGACEDVDAGVTEPVPFVWHSRHLLTLRDACREAIACNYLGFTPRDDFELYVLGTSNYQGAECDLEAWLKSMHYVTLQSTFRGDTGHLAAAFASMLAKPLNDMVGVSDDAL